MTCVRTVNQIGIYEAYGHKYPIFDTPIPHINIGDTVVLKYSDESKEVVTIRSNDQIVSPRCTMCKFGTQNENCPIHWQGNWYCIFNYGYAVSVDSLLEEL